MSIQKPSKKLYYSLRQTAAMVGLTVTTLKNWEKEFPQLKPNRNKAGNRFYTDKDITLLFRIKSYLQDENLSTEAIQDKLKDGASLSASDSANLKLRKILAEVKMEVAEILELLNTR